MHIPDHKHRAFQECSQELFILNEIARTLNASMDLSMILRDTLEKVADLVGLKTAWVLLFDEYTGEPYTAASLNLPGGLLEQPERMEGTCYCLEVFNEGSLTDASNIGVMKCSRLHELSLDHGKTGGLRFHASIPLVGHNGDNKKNPDARTSASADTGAYRIGMLNVASPEWRRLRDDELALLYTIGEMLSVAIERARLHARRLEAAQYEERLRLAREIHDTIAQDFSAIAFRLEAAEEALQNGTADAAAIRKNIESSLDLARKGLEEIRRSVLNLRAAPLEGRTLPEALGNLADDYRSKDGLDVTFELKSHSEDFAVPPDIETGLYRLAQEALKNIQRHAGACSVSVMFNVSESEVAITIEDDGRGFDVNDVFTRNLSGKYGLIGMRERVRLLGGRYQIESTPGTGTRIHASVPMKGRHGTAVQRRNMLPLKDATRRERRNT
jgi:two-component system, NarL family, sensor kinase